MDGVVFEGSNFWLDLHLALGTNVQALALAKQLLRSDYVRMAEMTVRELWKTASAAPFERLARERPYVPGIRDLLDILASRDVATCIVSSGPYELASRAQRDCRVRSVFARLRRDNSAHRLRNLGGGSPFIVRRRARAFLGRLDFYLWAPAMLRS